MSLKPLQCREDGVAEGRDDQVLPARCGLREAGALLQQAHLFMQSHPLGEQV